MVLVGRVHKKPKVLNTLCAYCTLSMGIIDSSMLISLAKIRRLDILKLLKTKITTIQDVYEECVEKGINLGYPDALQIKMAFDQKIISIEEAVHYKRFSGVSEIDSKIVWCAKEKKDYLFADDIKLGRRAAAENIEVRNTPDILLYLMNDKRLHMTDFKGSLQKLVHHKRLSEKAGKLYEKAGGIKNGESSKS